METHVCTEVECVHQAVKLDRTFDSTQNWQHIHPWHNKQLIDPKSDAVVVSRAKYGASHSFFSSRLESALQYGDFDPT
jgi:hypothetical protein